MQTASYTNSGIVLRPRTILYEATPEINHVAAWIATKSAVFHLYGSCTARILGVVPALGGGQGNARASQLRNPQLGLGTQHQPQLQLSYEFRSIAILPTLRYSQLTRVEPKYQPFATSSVSKPRWIVLIKDTSNPGGKSYETGQYQKI